MNTDKILKLAGSIVNDLSPIEKNIYKGILNINNKVAGVYYFDLNNAIPENFDDYQDRIFAKEFYAHPGSLQWNYYLFLLNDQLNADERITIEKNDKYARKYVLDEAAFEDFFTEEKSKDQLDSNIVIKWKAALDAADLQELYTDATYVAVQERFNSEKTLKLAANIQKKDKRVVLKINFINKIKLRNNYRAFPNKYREFEFGQVNLIRGINGVGKTSLFEAIELMICGKCLRNPSQDMTNGCIEAEFNNSGRLEKYQIGSNELYQARDSHWYSSNYNRGNYLFNSFNRFNFFNADAAHRFSTGNSEEEIQRALNNIVLGPEFSYIEERCDKFMDRIRPEYNRLTTELKAARTELAGATAVIANNKESDSLKQAKTAVLKNVKLLQFKGDNIEDLAVAEGLLNQLLPVLENFKRTDFTYETKKDFDSALSDFNLKKKRFDELENKIRGFNDELAKQTQNEKNITGQIEQLGKLLAYFEDERFLQLPGLDLQIKEAELNKNKTDFLKTSLFDINLSKITKAETPAAIIAQNAENIEKLQTEINALEKSIQDYLDRFSKIDGMIKQLKAIGKDFLDEDKNASDCPLCQSAFTRTELEKRILQLHDSVIADQSATMTDDRKRIKLLQQEITKLEVELQLTRQLDNTFSSFNPIAEKDLSLADIAAFLQQAILQSSSNEAILTNLRIIQQFAQSMGKSESELASLKSEIERLLGVALDFQNRQFLDGKLKALQQDLERVKLELKRITDERLSFGAELKTMFDIAPDKSFFLKEGKEIMEKEEAFFRLFDETFNQMKKLIDFDSESIISNLQNNTAVLVKQFETYKAEIKSQFLLAEAIKKRDNSKEFIEKNDSRFKRYEKAYNTLLGLTGPTVTDQLAKFFEANFAEIVDIFKSIHVPREFADLKYEDKHLLLVTHDKEIRTISQISTGQRSALVLSIFLCLNKKLKNGPDIILFDDPVSFIDDFNALSFLDYLRRDMLAAGKQLFFATANNRLASLFEKKFSFLEKDFRQWEFTR